VDNQPVPSFSHAGETYVLAYLGERYILGIISHTHRRIEAVVSVDGRDVIDGKPADFAKRGYLVPAWGSVDIDGWRLSERRAAAFRFSAVADSYAGRMGSARNVGVIGVAVFPERIEPPRPMVPAVPYGRRYDDFRKRAPEESDSMSSQAPAPPQASADEFRGVPQRSESAGAEPSVRDRAQAKAGPMLQSRPGLGTEFGESVDSRIHHVAFLRAHPTRPLVILGARYNDRHGLVAMGIDVDGAYIGQNELELRRTASPFPVGHRRYATPPRHWQP
jgi:hypothetical protein